MHPNVRGVAALTRVSLATVLLSGCMFVSLESPRQAGSNQPATSGLPVASTLVTPEPAPTSHVAVHWEPITGLEEAPGWNRLAAGPAGFVAIQDCRRGPGSNCATAWSSHDGTEWSAHPVPAVKKSFFSEITSGRGGYVIAGFDGDYSYNSEDGTVSGTPTIWRSPDGVGWDRVGHIGLDACCPDIDHLEQIDPWTVALAPSGDIIAGYVGGGVTEDLNFSDPLVLGDSGDWEAVEPSAFGVDPFDLFRVFSTPSEVLLFGGPCTECPGGIWSSTDGRAWARVGDLAIPTTWVRSVATDGRHSVATLSSCFSQQDPLCGEQIWATDEADGWSMRLALGPRTHRLNVFYTGSAFVAIGESFDGIVELGSLDGSTWTELAGNGSPACASSYAAHDDVMVAGRGECGWWRGTVEVVPGTRTALPPTFVPSARSR
jgi:hypothetical protein